MSAPSVIHPKRRCTAWSAGSSRLREDRPSSRPPDADWLTTAASRSPPSHCDRGGPRHASTAARSSSVGSASVCLRSTPHLVARLIAASVSGYELVRVQLRGGFFHRDRVEAYGARLELRRTG